MKIIQLKFQKCKLVYGSSSRRSKIIPFKKDQLKLYSSSFRSKNLYTAQVPEGAKLYHSKKIKLYRSSFRSKNPYTAQVPEGAKLYRSKRKNYTAQVADEKTCVRLKFQKEQNYTVQKGKIIQLKLQTKKPVYGSSSRRSKIIPFKKEKLYSSSFRSKNLYTAQVPEGAKFYRSKRKNDSAQVSEVKNSYTAQVPEGAHSTVQKGKII